MTRKDIEARINALKQALNNTDYKAIKAYEGRPSSDWDKVRDDREAWREEVDTLQAQLDGLSEFV